MLHSFTVQYFQYLVSDSIQQDGSIVAIQLFIGLNLRVKATLNHLNRDYLYLQLESVPHTVVDDVSSNIILETGDMFKEIETKKFFRHKIVIMDQVRF